MPTCLVTGCAGFIGFALSRRLLLDGFRVVGVDDLSSGSSAKVEDLSKLAGFRFEQRQIQEPGMTRAALAGDDLLVLFHLAAVTTVEEASQQPEKTMAVNYEATKALHREAMELGEGFVFAGSAAEYGSASDTRTPLTEAMASDEVTHPSVYGRSKYLATRLVEQSGFGSSLRCFNVYGPGQSPDSPYTGVITKFIKRARQARSLRIFGDGGHTRDFVHVDDVVDAYLRVAGLHPETGRPRQGVFNVGSGTSISILELARMINDLAGSTAGVQLEEERFGDVRFSCADISKIVYECGFHPGVGLEQGLAQFFSS